MEVTNAHVYNAGAALQQLAQEKLPVLVSFHLARLGKTLRPYFEAIEETRVKLVKEHRNGQDLNPTHPDWDAFQHEYQLLMREGVNLNFETVTIPTSLTIPCQKCGRSLELPYGILSALEPFIEVKP